MTQHDVLSPPRRGFTPAQAYEMAVVLHRQGRLNEAERVYRGILQLRPDHLGSLNYLASICNQQGRPEEGEKLLRRVAGCGVLSSTSVIS
jgi:Flp pilus assembly protein TadD